MISNYTFILVHGAYGSPDENWYPWLTSYLRENGAEVIIPRFPTPEGQELKNWLKAFDSQIPELKFQTVLIGHSIGVGFILRKLERIDTEIKASFLVSGFSKQLGLPDFDPINASFVGGKFNWAKIRRSCEKFFVYNSDNDPYVPLSCGQTIADELNAKFTVINKGGHINKAAGFDKFEILLQDLSSYLG